MGLRCWSKTRRSRTHSRVICSPSGARQRGSSRSSSGTATGSACVDRRQGDIAYSTYNPTPPADIAACLEDTMKYMRCESMQAMYQSFIVRVPVAHAHFEAVHPFRDGNGRVGRLLLPLMMAAEGMIPIYLSPYIEAHKTAYYDSLKAA
jgi:Fic family protein